MKKVNLILCFLLIGMFSLNAQEATIPNVLNIKRAQHSGEIIENRKLVGYYVFYLKEKVDKKNNAYIVELFDDNYNKSNSIDIVRPKSSSLVQLVYNGEVFLLHFYDSKTGYEFVTYDRSGKMLGSNKIGIKEISKYDISSINTAVSAGQEYLSIFANGTNGFIRTTLMDNKKIGYEVVAIDNNAKVQWSYKSNVQSPLVEAVAINDISNNVLAATVTRKKNLMTKEMQIFCLLVNTETGKLIKEIPMGDEKTGYRSLLKATYSELSNSLILVGEYYKPNDDIIKNKSIGLYIQELDLAGKELRKKEFKWKGNIDKFKFEIDPDDKKSDKPFYAFFHEIIISKNGQIFLIGEQFKKQVSALGIASQVLNSNSGADAAAAFEIRVGNMIVIEFNSKFDLVDFKSIEKKSTTVLLPAGSGLLSTTLLGYLVKSYGGFDYSFTSRDVENDKYEVVYIDANRKEEKSSKTKSDMMIGVITINKGEKVATRVPINSEVNNFWLQPAKAGYISVSEYYRKEKKVHMRLEQLSY
ncbi:MAG: hypothetical protein KA734_08380 [Fluviicola sp.]|nr:hypothetical protein [Fluviicola sp.]MBP6272611.1 hypothetical protein [Fluviicola sp.]